MVIYFTTMGIQWTWTIFFWSQLSWVWQENQLHFIESQKLHNDHFIPDLTWCSCSRCCFCCCCCRCCCLEFHLQHENKCSIFAAYFLYIAILRVDFCSYSIEIAIGRKQKKKWRHNIIPNRMWKLLVNIFEVVRVYCFQIKRVVVVIFVGAQKPDASKIE